MRCYIKWNFRPLLWIYGHSRPTDVNVRQFWSFCTLHKFKRQLLNVSDSTDCVFKHVSIIDSGIKRSFTCWIQVLGASWSIWRQHSVTALRLSECIMLQTHECEVTISSSCRYVCFEIIMKLNYTNWFKIPQQIRAKWANFLLHCLISESWELSQRRDWLRSE